MCLVGSSSQPIGWLLDLRLGSPTEGADLVDPDDTQADIPSRFCCPLVGVRPWDTQLSWDREDVRACRTPISFSLLARKS